MIQNAVNSELFYSNFSDRQLQFANIIDHIKKTHSMNHTIATIAPEYEGIDFQ